jgi:hypothetical protein
MADNFCTIDVAKLFPEFDEKQLAKITKQIKALKRISKSEVDFTAHVQKFINKHSNLIKKMRIQYAENAVITKKIVAQVSPEGATGKDAIKNLYNKVDEVGRNKNAKEKILISKHHARLDAIEGADIVISNGTKNKEILSILKRLTTIGGEKGIIKGEDELAYKIAKAFYESEQEALVVLHRSGIHPDALDGYTIRQVHNRSSIIAAGREKWKSFVRENDLVDKEKVFVADGGEDVESDVYEEFLDSVYTSLESGRTKFDNEDVLFDELIDGKNLGTLTNTYSKHRKFHLRDGEKMSLYFDEFGNSNLNEIMEGSLRNSAQHSALAETFGTGFLNGQAMYEGKFDRGTFGKIKDVLKKKHPELIEADFNGTFLAPEKLMKEIVNFTTRPIDNYVHKMSHIVRSANNLTMLGGTAPLAFGTDIGFSSIARAGAFNKSVLGSMAKTLSDMFAVYTNPELRKSIVKHALNMAETELLVSKSKFGESLSEGPGWLAATNKFFYKYSGIQGQTSLQKMTALRGIMSDAADVDVNNIPQSWKNNLKRFGITEPEFKMMMLVGVDKDAGGLNVLSTNKMVESGKLGPDLIEKYAGMVDAMMNEYVPTPGNKINAAFRQGLQQGTGFRAALDIVGQYKSFSFAGFNTINQAMQNRTGQKGFLSSMKTKQGGMFFGQAAVTMTSLGYGVLYLRDMIAGKEPRQLTDEDGNLNMQTMSEAFAIGGAGGLMADIMLKDYTSIYQNSMATSLLGPTMSRVEDGYEITQNAIKGLYSGDEKSVNKAKRLLFGKEEDRPNLLGVKSFTSKSFIGRAIPGNNLFYLKAGLNREFVQSWLGGQEIPEYKFDPDTFSE